MDNVINLDVVSENWKKIGFFGASYEVILLTLKELNLSRIELTIRFSNNSEIQFLNNLWKKNNKPTNVLAFPNNNKIDNISSYNYIGDIIISYDKVKNESIFYKVSLKDHLMHLIIHGVLHLMGYDHNNIKSEKAMIKLEKKIIEEIGADCTTLNRKYDERN